MILYTKIYHNTQNYGDVVYMASRRICIINICKIIAFLAVLFFRCFTYLGGSRQYCVTNVLVSYGRFPRSGSLLLGPLCEGSCCFGSIFLCKLAHVKEMHKNSRPHFESRCNKGHSMLGSMLVSSGGVCINWGRSYQP